MAKTIKQIHFLLVEDNKYCFIKYATKKIGK